MAQGGRASGLAQIFTAGVDIKCLRDQPEEVLAQWRENQKKRWREPGVIDQVIAKDKEYRAALSARDSVAKERSSLTAKMKDKSIQGDERAAIQEQCRVLNKQVEEWEAKADALFAETDKLLNLVGVMIAPDVPVSNDEADNAVVAKYGAPLPPLPWRKAHHQLLWMIDGYEPRAGARVAGHRGYYLKGAALKLSLALQRYGLDFLSSRGFTVMQTPYFMRRSVMQRCCQLEDFEEVLYHVTSPTGDPQDDLFLIATSEQTLNGIHLNEHLGPKDLPLRYGGCSACFRKEAGAAGKDNRGLFRLHQFDKIEQVIITSPHDGESEKAHQEMVTNAADFLRSLGIPFQIVTIVSNELNYSTHKKYDIEAWFPSYNAYRELVSGSNCLDFQSRKLDIRFGSGKGGGVREYVHMLNCTLCAAQRALCCVLELYQTPDGIEVPVALQPYLEEVVADLPPVAPGAEAPTVASYDQRDVDARAAAAHVQLRKRTVSFIPFVRTAESLPELPAAGASA